MGIVRPANTAETDAQMKLDMIDLSRQIPDLRTQTISLPGEPGPRHIIVCRVNGNESPDLIISSEGSRLDVLLGHGTGYVPPSQGSLIHWTDSRDAPVIATVNGESCFGLVENGKMVLYSLYTPNRPVWIQSDGPGQSGQLAHTSRFALAAPTIHVSWEANSPSLTLDPTSTCSHAVIYRSENGEPYVIRDTVPWTGDTPLIWHEIPDTPTPREGLYRVRAAWLPNGPDGALYHP